jgi:UPF0755 protein
MSRSKKTKVPKPKSKQQKYTLLTQILAGGGAIFLLTTLFLMIIFSFLFLSPLSGERVQANRKQPNVILFTVENGDSLVKVSQRLAEQGLTRNRMITRYLMQWIGINLKPGVYRMVIPFRPWDLLQKLKRGEVELSKITFLEGWTFRTMKQKLDENPDVSHSPGISDEIYLLKLLNPTIDGHPIQHLEGLFMPNTYHFNLGSPDLVIIKQAHELLVSTLEKAWSQRDPGLPLKTPYEALILASLIEKETGVASDRPLIASVFINRLRLNMRLQTDPSVIYGMGERFDGNIRKKDLGKDTLYNTYIRTGLPPTPIALPSKEAILAATHPAKTRYLYFVSRGDGSSQFSETLAEHNQAVQRYQLK